MLTDFLPGSRRTPLRALGRRCGSGRRRTVRKLALVAWRVLELALDPLVLVLALAGPDGPVAGAELKLVPQSSFYAVEPIVARTDEAGTCRVTLPGCCRYAWEAEARGADARGMLDVLSDAPQTLRFQPERGR